MNIILLPTLAIEASAIAGNNDLSQGSTSLMLFFTGVLAITAVLQLVLLFAQVFIYREQARTMRNALSVSAEQSTSAQLAAVAAEKSADALMASERAWIEILPAIEAPELHPVWEPGDPMPKDPQFINPFSHGFPAIIKNVGRTPARIEQVYVQYVMLQHPPDRLIAQPAYIDLLREHSFILVAGDQVPIMTYLSKPGGQLTKDEVAQIYAQRLFLYAYGVVRYKDVYDRGHETRFGYVYHFPQGLLVNFEQTKFRRAGPESYNRQT